MKYDVTIIDKVIYPEVEAKSEEEAKEIALQWWEKRVPSITTEESCSEKEKAILSLANLLAYDGNIVNCDTCTFGEECPVKNTCFTYDCAKFIIDKINKV